VQYVKKDAAIKQGKHVCKKKSSLKGGEDGINTADR